MANYNPIITLPAQPPANSNTVETIFGDDFTRAGIDPAATYQKQWILYTYTPDGYKKLGYRDTLEQGKGYWIIQKTGGNIVLKMPENSIETSSAFEYTLEPARGGSNQQWNLSGNPVRIPIRLGGVRLSTSAGVCDVLDCDLDKAKNEKLLHNEVWVYNGQKYITKNTSATLNAWEGFWVAALEKSQDHDLKLVYNDYSKLGGFDRSRYPENGLSNEYVVYSPKDGITQDMPVVIFLEGGGQGPKIDHYRGIMQFMASKGYFVIGTESGGGYDSNHAKRIAENAIKTAKNAHGLTISKLAVMGHSQGGGQAFYVMREFQRQGYGQEASLVISVDGWFSFTMNQADVAALQGDISFIQMNGLKGTGTDPRIHLSIWSLAKQTTRTFFTLPKNDHGYIVGDLNNLLNKSDLLQLIGSLTHDAFNKSENGYQSIPDERKASYQNIYDALRPESEYRHGDCAGNDYNAIGHLVDFDINYCTPNAY